MKRSAIVKFVVSFISIAVGCLIAASVAFAEGVPDILPDDNLYPLKRHNEARELAAASDALKKAAIRTKHAEERLAEAKALAARGNSEFVDGLMGDYENSMREATRDIERASGQGRDVSKALQSVERATQRHTEVLRGLLDRVPEQARPAIEHALNVSGRGRARALEVLGKRQEGKRPIGRRREAGSRERAEKPKALTKPKGAGKGRGGDIPEERGRGSAPAGKERGSDRSGGFWGLGGDRGPGGFGGPGGGIFGGPGGRGGRGGIGGPPGGGPRGRGR